MPELPEVETIRRDLEKLVLGKILRGVRVKKSKMVQGDKLSFQRQLRRQAVKGLHRRGKLLMWELGKGEKFLLVHLKMTGQLILDDGKGVVAGGHSWPAVSRMPGKHTHLIFSFQDGTKIYFNDQRQFGYARVVSRTEKEQIVSRYGVEPLERGFTRQKLKEILAGRKTLLKNILLNQKLIAGLGNIYVDEACFMAGIYPGREAGSLNDDEIARLWRSIRRVLRQAIKYRGTTFNDYRDANGQRGDFLRRLQVYGRAGQLCQKCQVDTLKKTRMGQRGTVYCPKCQV
jgi:formamidopyrimidine-DNA glycosylase